MKKMTGDNRGLSLIELLVSIVVLGIICIPLINTFINSARINRNAQRVHSASTLAQSIMEEYKASSMQTLLEGVSGASVSAGWLSGLTAAEQAIVSGNEEAFIPYTFYQTGITAANGHVYDARITLNPLPYSNFDLTVTNASTTNTAQIPDLPEIDNAKSAVIGNQINAQDTKAVSGSVQTYTIEKKILALFGNYTTAQLQTAGVYNTDMETTLLGISQALEKEIIVKIDKDSSLPDAVLVSCDVVYTYPNSLIADASITVNAYQAYYSIDPSPSVVSADDMTNEDIEGRLTTYLFWTPSVYNNGDDKISIYNTTPYRMNLYLVKQESVGGVLATYRLSDSPTSSTWTDFKPSVTHKDGRVCAYNINLVSNLGTEYSKLYEKDAKLRCYEVKVEIFEGNGIDVYDLTSTKQVTTMTSTKEVYQ